MIKKIKNSIVKFKLNLKGEIVLTEAATGNFVVTPIIAALAGANVYAYTINSKYGTINEVKKQTNDLASQLNVKDRIQIITDYDEIDLKKIDIITNTGFLRPIKRNIIEKLSSKCVIPLIWEPWEYRKEDIDIDACYESGIKVYGTNEDDSRLMTKSYIGYIVLYFLLKNKLSPFASRILLIGCDEFIEPVKKVLLENNYNLEVVTEYSNSIRNIEHFDSIVVLEHEKPNLIIGTENAFINTDQINKNTILIHIAGNVCLNNAGFLYIPSEPAPFGYMSFTTDFIDSHAVIDLHTAGLKVAEGMLEANRLNLNERDYKDFMESNYPALAFKNKKYW